MIIILKYKNITKIFFYKQKLLTAGTVKSKYRKNYPPR